MEWPPEIGLDPHPKEAAQQIDGPEEQFNYQFSGLEDLNSAGSLAANFGLQFLVLIHPNPLFPKEVVGLGNNRSLRMKYMLS